MNIMKYCIFYKRLVAANCSPLIVILWSLYYRLFYKKRIIPHHKTTIKGIRNINIDGTLEIGIINTGFMHKSDLTYLNIQGEIFFHGNYSIGRGCRFDVGRGAIVTIGKDGYINSNSKFIIMHQLSIGNNCAISWDCQFLDEDFHKFQYSEKRNLDNSITIGNNVWIGCGVKIYKGTKIPDGCVIASDSVVKGIFITENSLIGGIPAKVLATNIKWEK